MDMKDVLKILLRLFVQGFSKEVIWPAMCPLITQRGRQNKVRTSVMPLVCCSWHTVCSFHLNLMSHVHNYRTNVQNTLTHEHPSGESADEVKGEGVVVVVFFFFQYLRNNVIRNINAV